MRRVILRQTNTSDISPEQAERLVCAAAGARIIQRDGATMLVDYDPCQIDDLRDSLKGWIVSEQGAKIPVPDTCVRIKS